MNDDSLNIDTTIALDSFNEGVQTDSLNEIETTMPTPEQLGISISAGPEEGMAPITVGDTFEIPITISWSVQGSALLVIPTSSINAKGITQIGMSQQSARTVKNGKEIASITFSYKAVAQDTGNLHIPALRFEIPTQMGSPINLRSESIDIRINKPFNPLPITVGLFVAICVLGTGLWRIKRKKIKQKKRNLKNAFDTTLKEKMIVLKQRINSADSREWLLDLEEICKIYVLKSSQNFDENYTDKQILLQKLSSINLENFARETNYESWELLIKEFAHARYGGGKRDSFELRETWKLAMKLMKIEE